MKKCFDAGEIQAFFDGELATDAQETIARHVGVCDSCARLLAEAEEETAFAFAALERDFDGAHVPTERLRAKINRSIERESGKSVWQAAFETFKNLFANPALAAFAGLLIVAGVLLFARGWQTSGDKNFAARENKSTPEIPLPKSTDTPQNSPVAVASPQIENGAAKNFSNSDKKVKNYRVAKSEFAKRETRRAANRNATAMTTVARAPEFVSGEATYIKTIAALEKTVNDRKDEVLKPSARFSFEKDLAIADDAIAKMRREVERDPKNAAARQILLASYRNKVDLLGSVADKTELMASLK